MTIVDEATTPDRSGARDVARHLRAASPLIADVVVSEEGGGLSAVVHLDPLLVRSRALQQGLHDISIRSAATDPRVLGMIEAAVAQANDGCPAAERIVRFEVASR